MGYVDLEEFSFSQVGRGGIGYIIGNAVVNQLGREGRFPLISLFTLTSGELIKEILRYSREEGKTFLLSCALLCSVSLPALSGLLSLNPILLSAVIILC